MIPPLSIFPVFLLLSVFSPRAGSVLDITLIANVPVSPLNNFYIACVMGERDRKNTDLQIEKDNSIVRTMQKSQLQTFWQGNEIRTKGFSGNELAGVFFCRGKSPTEQMKVLYVYNSFNAYLLPVKMTVTVNVNDTAFLSAFIRLPKNVDVMWKSNGSFYQITYKEDIVDREVKLVIPTVSMSQTGVYSAGFMGHSPLVSAFFRLIVRGCSAKKWGPSCQKECLDCLNGGICHDVTGECVCPPGFMGTRCEKACREGRFGRTCQEDCPQDHSCSGLTFCLPDPYGCSCATGWTGFHCNEACTVGHYGADCGLECQCQNGGTCNRFSGCVCPSGWHGQHCEKSDRIPQIQDLESEVEFNLNSKPVMRCSATGNPPPVRESIELRKTDGSVLTARKAIMEADKTTSEFVLPPLTRLDSGLWECRVSTTGGQDNRKFLVTVKVPPVPMTPPRLLERKSRKLKVSPFDHFSGDGPITSINLLYKPNDTVSRWLSIKVGHEDVTLSNLEPFTKYQVKVQLSRPGEGGEGSPGPLAFLETDCPEPTVKPVIDGYSVEDKRNVHVNWHLPKSPVKGNGFILRLFHPEMVLIHEENVTSMLIHSARIPNLQYNLEYTLVVLIYHCTSLGAPSDPFKIKINSTGPSSPRNLQADAISKNAVQLTWLPPDDPNGGVMKYTIECQPLVVHGEQLWIDTLNENETRRIIKGLNASTEYQFRVRANSKGPGEWSQPLKVKTHSDGFYSLVPSMESRDPRPPRGDYQLLFAIIGSVSLTCVTIISALLALFCIKKNFFHRRRTFTYQSGSGEETILQFSSGTLTLTRRPKPQTESLSYPILEWEDITFQDMIGEGNFGQVIKAMIKKDGLKVNAAIKMLKEFASENDHRDFAGELEVLCKLGHHPNIINLLGACENKGYLYIAIEYAPYGNLLDFLRKSRVLETDPAFAKEHGTASTLTSQQLLQFASDVAKGMQYLSEKQFIHRDLAARNVLVGENLAAKIADFGLSRGEEVYVKKTMGRLPVRWMAIESLNYSVYTTKSDVWSFGVLLWEIVSLGGTPYCGMTCAELYEKLPQRYRMEKPRNCDDEVYDLMRQCWRDRPYERPTFAQISVQLVRMLEARKAYVNMALFENFTYAGIDVTAEEA
ncbi:tyrosine-protein kinase receptor Tie-1 isoform X1 [Microcaecilia unicolor]|uniref:Tyrosine-protein kinase receptor Tie-1 n=1 Tax=Microcaecilia unicolor TaxID=1415580 RepID=A0A6P7Y841_9AMPH|nr:tyrosine-protein kinase receptor Tie-1 isoform X1 [Microcaecilia unicolor]